MQKIGDDEKIEIIMIEYPSIISAAKAPRAYCIAFNKLDGSNFRAKWTRKGGFNTFGTRTQLINEQTPIWGEMISVFKKDFEKPLERKIKKDFPNEREVIVYGEFFGEHSFAGQHQTDESGRLTEEMQIVIFDILIGHKNRHFIPPMNFIKEYQEIVKIPDVIYTGNLNQEFIDSVRVNKYNLREGVICKGTQKTGAFRGHIWMCKIKTQDYFNKLRTLFGEKEMLKYWE